MSDQELVHKIKAAINNHSIKEILESTYLIDQLVTENGYFSDKIFSGLIDLLKMPQVHSFSDSSIVLKVFEYNMDFLSNEKKNELLGVFIEQYENFVDPASCILIYEIIVDNFSDKVSYHSIISFTKSKYENSRAISLAGLNYFITKFKSTKLAECAFKRIVEMKNDPSAIVKKEVNYILKNLSY